MNGCECWADPWLSEADPARAPCWRSKFRSQKPPVSNRPAGPGSPRIDANPISGSCLVLQRIKIFFVPPDLCFDGFIMETDQLDAAAKILHQRRAVFHPIAAVHIN